MNSSTCSAILGKYIDQQHAEGQALFDTFFLLSQSLQYDEKFSDGESYRYLWYNSDKSEMKESSSSSSSSSSPSSAHMIGLEITIVANTGSLEALCVNPAARIDDNYTIFVKYVDMEASEKSPSSSSISSSTFQQQSYFSSSSSSSSQQQCMLCQVRGWDGNRILDYDIDYEACYTLCSFMNVNTINISIFMETLLILLSSLPLYSMSHEEFPMPFSLMLRYLFRIASQPMMIVPLFADEQEMVRILYSESGQCSWIRGLQLVQKLCTTYTSASTSGFECTYLLSPTAAATATANSSSSSNYDNTRSVRVSNKAAFESNLETLVRVVEIRRHHSQLLIVIEIVSESNFYMPGNRFVVKNSEAFIKILNNQAGNYNGLHLFEGEYIVTDSCQSQSQSSVDLNSTLFAGSPDLIYDEQISASPTPVDEHIRLIPISTWNEYDISSSKIELSSSSINWASVNYCNFLLSNVSGNSQETSSTSYIQKLDSDRSISSLSSAFYDSSNSNSNSSSNSSNSSSNSNDSLSYSLSFGCNSSKSNPTLLAKPAARKCFVSPPDANHDGSYFSLDNMFTSTSTTANTTATAAIAELAPALLANQNPKLTILNRYRPALYSQRDNLKFESNLSDDTSLGYQNKRKRSDRFGIFPSPAADRAV